MKFSELALKKLNLITGEVHERRELMFVRNFVLPGRQNIEWRSGIALVDVSEFTKRVHDFNGHVIGLEVSQDAPYPMHVLTYSDFYSEYNLYWVQRAIQQFKEWKVERHIIPVVDFPAEVLNKYLDE